MPGISLKVSAPLRHIAAGLCALLATGSAQAATTIFDDETGLSSPGGYVVGDYFHPGYFSIGFQFTAPDTGRYDLAGGSFGGSFAYGVDQVELQVAPDDNGVPGPAIASADVVLTPTLSFVDFTLSPGAVLTPGATYWLLAAATDPDTSRAYWWVADVAAGSYPKAVSYDGGSYSAGVNPQPGLFSITATAVPEPEAWAMFMVGLGGVGWVLRRGLGGARAPLRGSHPR